MKNKYIDFVMSIEDLTPIERLILLFLINTSDENYQFKFNPAEIAYKCYCSIVKVYTSINNLEKRGFLEKINDKNYKVVFKDN